MRFLPIFKSFGAKEGNLEEISNSLSHPGAIALKDYLDKGLRVVMIGDNGEKFEKIGILRSPPNNSSFFIYTSDIAFSSCGFAKEDPEENRRMKLVVDSVYLIDSGRCLYQEPRNVLNFSPPSKLYMN